MRTLNSGNCKFLVPNDESGLELLSLSGWELNIQQVFRKHLNERSNVIDVGAHIGFHTVFLSKLCAKGRVFCFEPNQNLYPIIQANLKANKCVNVSFFPFALADYVGEGYMSEVSNSFLSAISKEETSNKIIVTKLDSLVKLPRIDLIKLDAEGSELSIIKGGECLIARDRPVLIIEIWDANILQYKDYLNSIGYSLRHIESDNYLALHSNRKADEE